MNNKKTDLLVPIDFRIYSLKSVEYAKSLQAQIKAKIHLLHVIEAQSWWEDFFNSDELVKSAKQKLQLLIKDQDLPNDTDFSVILGKRHKGISDFAKKINARYIILADNYPLSTGVKKLGSTLSQVIIKAKEPVISITENNYNIFKNIAVPLDLNQSCRLQLYNSVAMALQHNSKIHIVSVLFGEKDLKSSRINKKIEKYKKTYDENGIDFTVKLLVKEEGYAYKEILKYCDKEQFDSILIMTHTESINFDNYLGAFAQHIINESKIPVVSINNASAQYWEKKLGDVTNDPLNLFPKK